MIDKFDGGPVGIDTLAAATSEETDTIMDVYEPYLIQLGLPAADSAGPESRHVGPMSISGSPCRRSAPDQSIAVRGEAVSERAPQRLAMADFDYELPAGADCPGAVAGAVGEPPCWFWSGRQGVISHHRFVDLPELLGTRRSAGHERQPGDSGAAHGQARELEAGRSSCSCGRLRREHGWRLMRPARKLRIGERVVFGPATDAHRRPSVMPRWSAKRRMATESMCLDEHLAGHLDSTGGCHCRHTSTIVLDDDERYQTVYAQRIRVGGGTHGRTALHR